MTRRLLVGYLTITLIVLLAFEIPLAIFYSQREEERFTTRVERDAVVLSSFYEDVLDAGAENDPAPAMDYADRTGARVVVTDAEGLSLLDTDQRTGRDFSTRPEVGQALTGSRATGIRHSDTLGTDLLFVAVPIASGGTVHGVLRLTVDAHEVFQRVERFWLSLAAMALVVLAAVAVVGWAVARSVTRPLRQLQTSARRFAEGDLSVPPPPTEAPEEVQALAHAMGVMAGRLDELIGKQRAFVSDASHQLRTPLTALRLRLENLEARLGDGGDAADAEAAIDETRRLSELVDDLLKLAQAEQAAAVEPIDVATVAAQRADTWSALADVSSVTLELDGPQSGVWATAVPGSVEQILDNLLDNAVSAGPEGSSVTVSVGRRPGSVVMAVCDRGPGLSDEAKERALERFWRGSQATPGTGLGLPIAHSLAEAAGGTLTLSDRPGGGLTAQVTLPETSAPQDDRERTTSEG
ncbi:MAG: HAMP domain-containing protein [Microthrixaceae bacterium]|nr:HAMP domain-containing protein [Microthrixaceae bacterium]